MRLSELSLTCTKRFAKPSSEFREPLCAENNIRYILGKEVHEHMLQQREAVESVQTTFGVAVLRPDIVWK